jgi:DNA-binding phage protein
VARKSKLTDEMVAKIMFDLTMTRKPKYLIAKEIGISRESLYRYLRKIRLPVQSAYIIKSY